MSTSTRKIAILGGPGTGKTTLCKQLDVDYSMAGYRTGLCLEYVRTYITRYGVPSSIYEQFLLYEGQKQREDDLRHCDLIFCDNATILNYVYGLMSCNFKDPKEIHALTQLFALAMNDLPKYDIFYIPREFDFEKDGVRYQDEDEANNIDRRIQALLDLMHLPYTIVSGTLPARVTLIKDKIGFNQGQQGDA